MLRGADMNKNLLIIGAGCCGLSAKETAEAMGSFGKISFLDDNIKETSGGIKVLGTVDEFANFVLDYSYIFVAIANPEIKMHLTKKIKETTTYKIATLISPRAYISPSAQIMEGSLVEAMAVVNTGSVIAAGCIIGAASVVNHCSVCCEGVHLECSAIVADNTIVPAGTFVDSGEVFLKKITNVNDLFFCSKNWHDMAENLQKPHGPLPINGREYCFEDGM